MAWQRKIPFGYIIRDGLIQPHPQEADAVRYIFGQYLAGASLLAIAEDMTGRGPRYHQHTPEWNKHMVKRILENAKYVGAGGYPRLVSDEDFAAAQGQRGERNTYAPLPAEIRPIQGKAVCGLCGATLARGTRSHGTVHWKCQNPDCGQNIAISDGVLAGLVDKRLRELAQAPHLLTAPEPQRAGVDMDAVRLQNELTLALNRGGEPSVNAKQKMSIFAEIECHFSAVSIAVYTALIHHFTCRLEACQALIYQLVSGLTGENGKYNYSIAVHVYPPFFDIPCSAKNYKIAPALTYPSAGCFRGLDRSAGGTFLHFVRADDLEGVGSALFERLESHLGRAGDHSGANGLDRQPGIWFRPPLCRRCLRFLLRHSGHLCHGRGFYEPFPNPWSGYVLLGEPAVCRIPASEPDTNFYGLYFYRRVRGCYGLVRGYYLRCL